MDHTTIRNGNLFCTHCGGQHNLIMPIPVTQMLEKTDAFNKLHKDCLKTWTEPEADQKNTVYEKAMFWNANGQHGASSKTMWNCFMNNKDFRVNHPYDPDDFSRCYKLLVMVPEWKNELDKLKTLSKPWENLVNNWDVLTEMYELNVENEWKYADKIGMYQLMKKLIK